VGAGVAEGTAVGLGVKVVVTEGMEVEKSGTGLSPWGTKVISRIPPINPIRAAAVIRLN
jgi:hypothetical protein